MKTQPRPQKRAAALITTLILLSAVALVTISYFAISRNESAISASHLSGTRSELAERAAFEDAKNLLLSATGNDDYLVTSVMDQDPGDDLKTRYTFLTIPTSDELTHVPLFSGGMTDTSPMPDVNSATTVSLADSPIAAPSVEFDGTEESGSIETYGITHLDETGAIAAENRLPEIVFQEIAAKPDENFEIRYTYWIEDMEGLPNIDVVGGWTDQHDGGSGRPGLDYIRPGYGERDSRTNPDDKLPQGIRVPFAEDEYLGWQFPKEFRGQHFAGQVAPGLSPREILLQPWSTSEMSFYEHPYLEANSLISARHWLAPGGSYIRSSKIRKENRFILGLRPYKQVPKIPYGHGYADEGEVRYNLNTLVTDRALSSTAGEKGIVEIIQDNLPDFEEGRKGGFPDEESYLATIAANAIDYADENNFPTHPGNTIRNGGYLFRGVDSYCVVNEFFVKFEYKRYENSGTNWNIVFEATPYIEFWNTSNQTAVVEGTRLKFRFLEPIQFKTNFETYRIEDVHVSEDSLNDNLVGMSFSIQPNEMKTFPLTVKVPDELNGGEKDVVAKIVWKVPVPKDPASPIAFPVVQDLRGVNSVTTRAHYELVIWDGEGVVETASGYEVVIDQSGRSSDPAAAKNDYGFFFKRHAPVMEQEDFIMRMTVPPVAGKGFGFNAGFTSHLGDPWMPFYSQSTFEAATYDKKASPGFRNFDADKTGRDWYKDETRVRDWPDGGYDNFPSPDAPAETVMPDEFANAPPVVPPDPELAPWRISNLGRYYSVTELGNLHDPVMWVAGEGNVKGGVNNVEKRQSDQLFDTYRDTYLKSLPIDAEPGKGWGGGNTLRIGRPEHELFDQPGLRASQLLDLFQTGFTGTNLTSVAGEDIYANYDPRDHQPPPAAPNPIESKTQPYSIVYPEELNAEGIFQRRFGHININSAPTVFEIETMLRGPFASSAVVPKGVDPVMGPDNTKPLDGKALANGLVDVDDEGIHQVALGLYRARPFLSPSHLARVLSQLMKKFEVLPEQANDAEMEETFARIFNTTSFSSRHFRIFTYGEIIQKDSKVVMGRSRRVYLVFLRPTHEADGSVSDVRLEILSSRDL